MFEQFSKGASSGSTRLTNAPVGVIETEEREDIRAALEELAYVARQQGLGEEVDEWRDW
jgi:hypothetical protein